MHNIKRLCSILLFGALSFSTDTQARIAKLHEIPVIYKQENIRIKVNSDFTYSTHITKKILVNNEDGKGYGITELYYSDAREKIKLINLYTQNGSKKKRVPSEDIRITNESIDAHTISDIKKIKIIFPDVKVGSVLHVEYKIDNLHTRYNKMFLDHLDFDEQYIEKLRVEIISPTKLFFDFYDKGEILKTEKKRMNKNYKYIITNKNIINKYTIFEDNIVYDSQFHLGLSIYSSNNFDQAFSHFIPRYEKIINGKLPSAIKTKIKEIKAIKSNSEKIYNAIKFIITNINYVSDIRSVAAGFYPKEIHTIWNSKYGDCKDFSALLVRILRELGFKANPVAIARSWSLSTEGYKVARHIMATNHIIVYAEIDGTKFYLDPTNSRPYVHFINQDISSRKAYLFANEGMVFTMPPATPIKFTARYNYTDPKSPSLDIHFRDHSFELIRRDVEMMDKSDTFLKDAISNILALNIDSSDFEISEINDHHIKVNLTTSVSTTINSLGKKSLLLTPPLYGTFKQIIDLNNPVGSIAISEKIDCSFVYLLPKQSEDKLTKNKMITIFNKPWLNFKLEYQIQKNNVSYKYRIKTKKLFIRSKEIRKIAKQITANPYLINRFITTPY